MGTTQEFYRNRGRLPRYTTKLNTMSSGMYLTDQIIPEGYARILVNYDIDDTGSNIRTKNGRKLLNLITPNKEVSPLFDINYKSKLGATHITDYISAYNKDLDKIESIKDVVMSFGDYNLLSNYVPNNLEVLEELNVPLYISKLEEEIDTNLYNPNTDDVTQEGRPYYNRYDNAWTIYCDKGSEDFNIINNDNIGYVSARTIKNAYTYDKRIKGDLGKPISTVLNNEIYAFSGNPIKTYICPGNPERNRFAAINKPDLTKLILKQNEDGSYSLSRKVLEPRELTVTEAGSNGFNILADSPYLFDDVSGGAPAVLSLMLYENLETDIPILSPTMGSKYSLRIYYQYTTSGTSMEYKIMTKDFNAVNTELVTVKNWTSFESGEKLYTDFIPNYAKTYVVVVIRLKDDVASEYVLPRLFDCSNAALSKLENKEYSLYTAKGMVAWQGSIGLYGVDGAPETIFFSDVEDPSYFPFPHNVMTFDNEILAVHRYLDLLLVITTDAVWLVSPGDNIGTSTIKRIMSNIFIPELDAINAVILKDQIFFKTDTQFYVLKPNAYTSDASDLKNYTNSTAIANYTIEFTKETLNILNKVYRKVTEERSKELKRNVKFTDFDVTNVQSVVKDSEVHYVYTIKPYIEDKQYDNLNLHLVYNTITRSYRMYLVGIGDDRVAHSALLYRNKQSGAHYEVVPFNSEDSKIAVIKDTMELADINIVVDEIALAKDFNNYQYIDTGHVSLEDSFNKRFRELQFNLINKEHEQVDFYADFKVDGCEKIVSKEYNVNQIIDKNDPEYGTVYVTPSSITNLELYGDTSLDSESDDTDKQYWSIDLSKFPELTITTVRMQLLGKGRRCSIELLNTSLKRYTLSTMLWVYRIMNVR